MYDLKTFSAYIYWFLTILLVVLLYAYVYHIYRSEKKGERDYEQYGRLALDDELDDKVIEPYDRDIEKNESKKES